MIFPVRARGHHVFLCADRVHDPPESRRNQKTKFGVTSNDIHRHFQCRRFAWCTWVKHSTGLYCVKHYLLFEVTKPIGVIKSGFACPTEGIAHRAETIGYSGHFATPPTSVATFGDVSRKTFKFSFRGIVYFFSMHFEFSSERYAYVYSDPHGPDRVT